MIEQHYLGRQQPVMQYPQPLIKSLLLTLMCSNAATAVPLPFVCTITSQEDPMISIQLTQRTLTALHGVLMQDETALARFATSRPKHPKQTIWHVSTEDGTESGTAILFQDDHIWNPYRPVPRPQDTNKILFVGLDVALFSWKTPLFRSNPNLLKAAAGFWEISSTCLGGRIKKG